MTVFRWDITQGTWHLDIDHVGRYSVRRMGKRRPYAAYLNGDRLMSEQVHSNADIVKRHVEARIEQAMRIAKGN